MTNLLPYDDARSRAIGYVLEGSLVPLSVWAMTPRQMQETTLDSVITEQIARLTVLFEECSDLLHQAADSLIGLWQLTCPEEPGAIPAEHPRSSSDLDPHFDKFVRSLVAISEFVSSRFSAGSNIRRLGQNSETIEAIRAAMERIGRDVFLSESFTTTTQEAVNYLRVNRVGGHGRLGETNSVFVPDLATATRYYAVPMVVEPLAKKVNQQIAIHPRLIYFVDPTSNQEAMLEYCLEAGLKRESTRPEAECHLCDSLWDTFERAEKFREIIIQRHELSLERRKDAPDNLLIILSAETGSKFHRSVDPRGRVWTLARNELVQRAIARQGIGMPLISSIYPKSVWDSFEPACRDFLLEAARRAGEDTCVSVPPSLPSEEDLKSLSPSPNLIGDPLIMDHHPFGNPKTYETVENKMSEYNARQLDILDRLGLGRYASTHLAGHYTYPLKEVPQFFYRVVYSSSYDDSIRIKNMLELQPLHKRVLGLLEYVITRRINGPKLKDLKRLQRDPSSATSKWWHANRSIHPKILNDDDNRTAHFILGSWLLIAQASQSGARLTDVIQKGIMEWQNYIGLTSQ